MWRKYHVGKGGARGLPRRSYVLTRDRTRDQWLFLCRQHPIVPGPRSPLSLSLSLSRAYSWLHRTPRERHAWQCRTILRARSISMDLWWACESNVTCVDISFFTECDWTKAGCPSLFSGAPRFPDREKKRTVERIFRWEDFFSFLNLDWVEKWMFRMFIG